MKLETCMNIYVYYLILHSRSTKRSPLQSGKKFHSDRDHSHRSKYLSLQIGLLFLSPCHNVPSIIHYMNTSSTQPEIMEREVISKPRLHSSLSPSSFQIIPLKYTSKPTGHIDLSKAVLDFLQTCILCLNVSFLTKCFIYILARVIITAKKMESSNEFCMKRGGTERRKEMTIFQVMTKEIGTLWG